MWAESSLVWFPKCVCPSEGLAFPPREFGCGELFDPSDLGGVWTSALSAPIFLFPEVLYSFLLGQGCGQRWEEMSVFPALQSQEYPHVWVISSLSHGVWEQGAVGSGIS